MIKLTDELAKIEEKVYHMAQTKIELCEAELLILREVLNLGGSLLSEFIRMSAEVEKESAPPLDSTGAKMAHKGVGSRQYLSIFGKLEIKRPKYYSPTDKTFYPLDGRLNLPSRQKSYLLQEWLCMGAIEKDYRESVELLNAVLGLDLNPMQSLRIVDDVGRKVAAYYEEKPAPGSEWEGSCLCLQADGKGVRIVESDRDPPAAKQAHSKRLMKGQKRGVKKMATVSLSFSFDPARRSPEEMLKSLHKKWNEREKAEMKEQIKQTGEKPRAAKNIHKRAFLGEQRKAIRYAIGNLQKRNPEKSKTIIAIVDAGTGLEAAIVDQLSLAGEGHRLDAIILDIIHVSEYVWKVANAYKGEKHARRLYWVEKMILRLLKGQVVEVIEEFRKIALRTQIKKNAKLSIQKAITYFENHQHKMDYKTYLEKGYPISTGLVEGSCGHLVKERMEGSGMRWTMEGAQNMLDLRATKINRDLKDLFHKIKADNKTRLHNHTA